MRQVIMMLSFAALSACAAMDEDPAHKPAAQGETDQSVCSDVWECWCNGFSTRATCDAASTPNGWHCYWAGAAVAASTANVSLCHATYE